MRISRVYTRMIHRRGFSTLVLFIVHVGVPYQNNVHITYQLQDTHYTAVVQLADMFDGGGVQTDHYNLQLDNGTLLRTAGPTYSVDVANNVTVFMSISAYNCAGYSDSFFLEISKGCRTQSNKYYICITMPIYYHKYRIKVYNPLGIEKWHS